MLVSVALLSRVHTGRTTCEPLQKPEGVLHAHCPVLCVLRAVDLGAADTGDCGRAHTGHACLWGLGQRCGALPGELDRFVRGAGSMQMMWLRSG